MAAYRFREGAMQAQRAYKIKAAHAAGLGCAWIGFLCGLAAAAGCAVGGDALAACLFGAMGCANALQLPARSKNFARAQSLYRRALAFAAHRGTLGDCGGWLAGRLRAEAKRFGMGAALK